MSKAIQDFVERAGFSVVRAYCGHGIGRAMHEAPQIPNYWVNGSGRGPRLQRGMTLAVEPMVNVGTYDVEVLSDGWTVVTKDGKLSAHYENTILITDGEPEIFDTKLIDEVMLMDFSIGQVIYSKAGRDKRRPFIILRIDKEYLYLCDGRLRLVNKPKKKKMMHVQPTKVISIEIVERLKSGAELKDSDVRTALKDFLLKEKVSASVKTPRKDAKGNRVKEVVNGKKVTVYDTVQKTVKKDNDSRVAARRRILASLYTVTEMPEGKKKKKANKVNMADKMFDDIAPKYADRNGGYTRMVKIGQRKGDAAEMVVLELV
ncbi:methionine aminopeptidase [Holotrichia oblita]|nr:methionine aminopeptidase [Holotrichia oblita]